MIANCSISISVKYLHLLSDRWPTTRTHKKYKKTRQSFAFINRTLKWVNTIQFLFFFLPSDTIAELYFYTVLLLTFFFLSTRTIEMLLHYVLNIVTKVVSLISMFLLQISFKTSHRKTTINCSFFFIYICNVSYILYIL